MSFLLLVGFRGHVIGRPLLSAGLLEARTAQLHLGQDAVLGEDAAAAMTAEILSLRQ